MTDWIVRMDVHPQLSNKDRKIGPGFLGWDEELAAIGGMHRTFNVQGEEILDAYREAELIITGIKTNPRVWRCHITAIEKTRR